MLCERLEYYVADKSWGLQNSPVRDRCELPDRVEPEELGVAPGARQSGISPMVPVPAL
jgi:hypothetical protein